MSSSATGVGMPICFLGAILLILTQKSSQKFGDVLGIIVLACETLQKNCTSILNLHMKIKTLFKTIFCAGLVLTLVLYLCHLYGNYIEKTQEPITGYTYNGFEEKLNYKRSNIILITYKSKQYVLHTGDRVLDKIKSGDFPKLYYSSKNDYLFFEGDYLPVGYAQAALLFTFVFPIIGTLIWRKELNNDIRTM